MAAVQDGLCNAEQQQWLSSTEQCTAAAGHTPALCIAQNSEKSSRCRFLQDSDSKVMTNTAQHTLCESPPFPPFLLSLPQSPRYSALGTHTSAALHSRHTAATVCASAYCLWGPVGIQKTSSALVRCPFACDALPFFFDPTCRSTLHTYTHTHTHTHTHAHTHIHTYSYTQRICLCTTKGKLLLSSLSLSRTALSSLSLSLSLAIALRSIIVKSDH